MKSRLSFSDSLHQLVTERRFKNLPALDRLMNQFGPLGKNPSGPQGVVPDLPIAHIIIAWHPDGLSMGLQGCKQFAFKKFIETRGLRHKDPVTLILFSDADSIQDDQKKRPGRPVKLFNLFSSSDMFFPFIPPK